MKENFGLDIGSSSIKAVWMKKGNVGTAVYDIPFGVSDRERCESITRGIEKIVKENRPGSKRAVCVISGDFVFVHHFKLPITKEDKLKSAVVLEAKKYLPSSIKNIVLDFVVLKDNIIRVIKMGQPGVETESRVFTLKYVDADAQPVWDNRNYG